MKQLLIIVMLFLCFVSKAQQAKDTTGYYADSLAAEKRFTEYFYKQEHPPKGNSKFKTDLKYVQAFLLSAHHSIKDFEQTLCYWDKDDKSRSSYEWNDKTKTHDIPIYEITYYNRKTKMYVPWNDYYGRNPNVEDIELTYYVESKITSISFPVFEYDMEDKIIPQLKALGYVKNKGASRFHNALYVRATGLTETQDRHFYYKNPKNNMGVYIRYEGNKWYYVSISRLKP